MATKLHGGPLAPLVVLAALTLLFAGCGDDRPAAPPAGATGGDDLAALDLDEPFGGLTMADEPAGFDDPLLLAGDASAEGQAYQDDLADDPEVQAWLAAGEQPGDPDDPRRPRFTFLRILWGALETDADDPDAVDDLPAIDWSGQLRVDRGIVLVRRVIAFERPEDGIVRPRPDRHTVAWTSQAGRDVDGLLIQIIEPPRPGPGPDPQAGGEDDPPPPPPNMLHLTAGPFTATIAIPELAELDTVYPIEGTEQAIHLTGFTLGDLDACPRGFLAGRWLSDPEDPDGGGFFHGRWVGIDGRIAGHLRGVYGWNEQQERVYFGKVIDRRGRALGLLAGGWGPGQHPGYGWFRGRWFGADREVLGVLDGLYVRHPEHPAGLFQGRWSALCDDADGGPNEGS